MAAQRRRIYFSGRVQGVGFRASTNWIARGFDVAGYVRNLPDGRVEALVEGEPAELDRFVDSIRDELGGFIKGVDAVEEPAGEPPLVGFAIRY